MKRIRWPAIELAEAGLPSASLAVRLAWMAAIWVASIAALGLVALLIRTMIL